MIRQKMILCVAIGVTALSAMAASSAYATVVTSNLAVWLDAADYNGDGVAGTGTGTTWKNLAATGSTYDATLAAAGSGPGPGWAGTGTTLDPYRLQFRPVSDENGPIVTVKNSGLGSALDTSVYTYEIWARRNGVGTATDPAHWPSGYSSGRLIGHGTIDAGQGNGGIHFMGSDTESTLKVWTGTATAPWTTTEYTIPGSGNVFTKDAYHQFVLTRAGNGATDTNFYVDGVLKGSFACGSNASNALLAIGAREWLVGSDFRMDMDVAGARVYTAALSGTDVAQNFAAGIHTPEPSALVLLSTALAGLLAYAWRKRK
jgi:hypothetical protein